MAETKKMPCTVSISEKLLEELDKYANELDESRSVVIQRFIREGLAKAKKKAGR